MTDRGAASADRSEAAARPAGPDLTARRRGRHRTRGGGWSLALVVAAYTALAVFGWWHAWSVSPRTMASGGADSAMSMWYLTWAPYALAHGHNPFFSNLANYPYGVNLAENAVVLPLGYLTAPVTLLGGPVLSFNVLATLGPILSALAAYAMARRFVRWRPAAFVAGLLYGFSPFMIGQGLGHINLDFAPVPPLVVLLVHDIVVRQRGRPVLQGLALGALLVLQFFVQSEIFLDTLVMGAIALVLLAALNHRQIAARFGYVWRAAVPAGLLVAVCVAYPAWFALKGPAHIVGLVQPTPEFYRADLLGIVLPDSLMHFAPMSVARIADAFGGNASENGSYLGIPLLLLALGATVWLRRNRLVVVMALVAACAFVLSLGSRLIVKNHQLTSVRLPQTVFNHLPLTKNMIPVRFSLFVVLCVALILAVTLERVRAGSAERLGRRWAAVPALGIAVVCLLPLVPQWPYAMSSVAVPRYYSSPAVHAVPEGSVVLTYPYPNGDNVAPELWQATTFFHFKMVGGSFALPQPGTGTVGNSRASITNSVLSELAAGTDPGRDEHLRAQVVAQLRSWDVQTVIATPDPARASADVGYLSWLLGRQPVRQQGAYVWYRW